MSTGRPRILFAGGGTGGHVYPALAIAQAVQELVPDAVIEFAGTTTRIEWRVVPEAGFKIHAVTVSPLHRKLTLRNLSFPVNLLRGLAQSIRLIKSFKPDVVVGTGGYVAGPVLWAAARAGVPTVLQEQNAFAGKTNKLLSRRAAQVHIAFDEARDWFPGHTCHLSGNPTRKQLLVPNRADARRFFEIAEQAKVVLVFGGSLGSAAINAAIAANHEELLKDPDLFLIWQTGKHYYQRYKNQVTSHERLRLLEYIDRMDMAYAAADIVVARAGAITCSELELTGTPAILIPSPNVAEDHQSYNARSLADDGAAVFLAEKGLESNISQEIGQTLADTALLERMRARLAKRARPDAAKVIAKHILELIGHVPSRPAEKQEGRQ
ncbi:MAG: undecaprenyldiphospho-muramoylpentapeptide beta-N-acetylglucosaminyltransferase [Rhodothermales bacterium]|nr:undecaprenyldiphospho-muramoylpentapeptide beta-N-acetylglucosaminyltransferase [Rhodothermales bacterium]